MHQLLKAKVNLRFLVNPFFLYCIAFSVAIMFYLLGWSRIFPPLSPNLILFFALTFIVFIPAGIFLNKRGQGIVNQIPFISYIAEIVFGSILLLGLLNVLYMGYLPVADHSHDYRDFGMPVIDPLFNTLSIFFSVFMIHSFLDSRKKRYLLYFAIIAIVQILLYRRSTIIWIFTSSSFLYIFFKKKVSVVLLLVVFILIPFLSYCFGMFGIARGNLSRAFVLDELGASERFKNTGLSYNHYMTYLYISSPLANLQKNIDERNPNLNNGDFKSFLFYCLIPKSVTLRLEKPLHMTGPDNFHISPNRLEKPPHMTGPECSLISPNLTVGSFYMVAFFTLGWKGMIIIFLSLIVFILICLYVVKKCSSFGMEVYAILSTFVSLLIFSNFMNRLEVILMLVIYPVIFHFIFKRNIRSPESEISKA